MKKQAENLFDQNIEKTIFASDNNDQARSTPLKQHLLLQAPAKQDNQKGTRQYSNKYIS